MRAVGGNLPAARSDLLDHGDDLGALEGGVAALADLREDVLVEQPCLRGEGFSPLAAGSVHVVACEQPRERLFLLGFFHLDGYLPPGDRIDIPRREIAQHRHRLGARCNQ